MKLLNLNQYKTELLAAAYDQLQEQIESQRIVASNKLNVSLNITDLIPEVVTTYEPIIRISPLAMTKMRVLTDTSPVEIAAQGFVTARKTKLGKEFTVNDIIMYPQKVTGVTTQPTDEYHEWLTKLTDEQINTLRFQFHSHVNMSTSPSGQDEETYLSFMQSVRDFYIFMILNKRDDYTIRLYDLETNLMYDSEDIDVRIMINNKLDEDQYYVMETKKYIKEEPKPKPRTYKPLPDYVQTKMGRAYYNDRYTGEFYYD